MLQLKIQGEKKKHNSENVLQEILQQMFELTARCLNTGLRAFDGIIDNASITEFCQFHTPYLPSSPQRVGAGEYIRSLRYPHK